MFNALFGNRKRALLTVLAWILLIGVITTLAPTLKDVQSPGNNNAPETSASVAAQKALKEHFPGTDSQPAIITVRGGEAETHKALDAIDRSRKDSDRFGPSISTVCTKPGESCMPSGTDGMVSEDGNTQLIIVPVQGDPTTTEYRDDIKKLRENIATAFDTDTDSLTTDESKAHVTGPVGIITDTVNVFAGGDMTLLLATVLLVLVILLAVYRAPLMALLPLFAVGMAMRLAETFGALLAQAGVIEISSQTASIMTVLLFGVGTDYALIINARWREYLRTTENHAEAMVKGMQKVFPVILSSAGTIVAAMLALLVTKSPTLQGFGPYLAIGVAAAFVAAFTLLPALMVLAGRAAMWPIKPEKGHDSRFWTKVADIVVARPRALLAGTGAVLLLFCLGLVNYSVSYNIMTGFRIDTDSAAGQKVIAQDLGAGEIAPTTLLITGQNADKAAEAVATELPKQAAGDVTRAAFEPRMDVAKDGDTVTAARVTVVLNADPYAHEGFQMLDSSFDKATDIARAAGGDDIQVQAAGETATTDDTRQAIESDIKLLIPLIFGVIALILGVLLRSWAAPLYLIVTLAISFVAALGLVAFIALTLQGDSGFGSQVPVYVLVFLTALGVDYTLFVMARLKQELPNKTMIEAMRQSIITTGGVVSSAGLILAATFAVLMTQPIRELYQFGMAMGLGILLDTFIIRPLMVPAIVVLLGDKAMAPSKPGIPADKADQAVDTADQEEVVVS